MVPGVHTTVAGPHSLEAVTLASQVGKVGLQPRSVVPVVQLAKTGAVATCQVKVRVQVVVWPHPVAVRVNTWVRLQPLVVIAPAEQLIDKLPHSLVAVMAPPKPTWLILAQEGNVAGLQPRSMVLSQLENTGGVVTCQLKIRVQVAKEPQPIALAT
jgi:hypothetical protein